MQDASALSEQSFFQEWRAAEKKGYTHLMLVTANRLRMGKTYAAIRLGELLDPKFTIDNIGFETSWYVQQADKSDRGSVLVLDEPNRAAGNRSWYTEENRGFAEYLQTNAYRGIHGLFPLPHQHLMDNAVTGVCTGQIVMTEPGHSNVYTFERDQLNRAYSTYTPNWGELFLKKPDAKLCHAYEKKRDEYTRERNKIFLGMLEAATEVNRRPSSKDLINTIIEKQWSTASEIQEGLGINRTSAYDLLKRAKHEAMRRKIVYVSQ
jgi:hypothetical protein